MPAKKRSKLEIKKDRIKIAEMYIQGYYQVDIGKELILDFLVGWNLFSVPYPPNTYQAQTLLDEINSDGSNCTEILRWSNGGWEAHVDTVSFNDFDIYADRGYFVICTLEKEHNNFYD